MPSYGFSRRARKIRARKRLAAARKDAAYKRLIAALPQNVRDAMEDKEFDEARPLVFDVAAGTHRGCGGQVKRSSYHGDSGCLKCGRLIPPGEVIEGRAAG